MEYILTITFICTNGKKSSLTIEGVKSTITDEEVNTLMDTIITNNIFLNTNGALLEKASASLTQREVKDFAVAEA